MIDGHALSRTARISEIAAISKLTPDSRVPTGLLIGSTVLIPPANGSLRHRGAPKEMKSDAVIACAGWICCFVGCLIFGGVLLSYTELDDPWITDSCYVIGRDDSCLDGTHENCAVSVKALVNTDPVRLLSAVGIT